MRAMIGVVLALLASAAGAQQVIPPNPSVLLGQPNTWLAGQTFGGGIALNNANLLFGALYSSGPTPATPGTDCVPGNLVTVSGGTSTTAATARFQDCQAVSATIAAAGSGGTNGACTVTGTTGTVGLNGGTLFQASVTISGNAISAVNSISRAGDYIANPTTIAAEPVTGCSLSGAQLNVVMGDLFFSVQNTGSYTIPPNSPVSVSGSNATLPVSFGPIAATVLFPNYNQAHAPGGDNFYLGSNALGALTTGYFNLAIGVNALSLNTTGPESVAIGWNAGQNYVGTGGSGNVLIGVAAGRNLTTGTANVAIGTDALNGGATTSTGNVVIGQSAASGGGSDLGSNNVIVGQNAMKNGTSGRVTIVAIGANVMSGKSDNSSVPARMTVIGSGALNGANLGSPARTVVIGDITGGSAFAASDSVLIGSTAGNNITSGGSEVIIGSNTGASVTTGSSNTLIGKNVAQTTLVSGNNNVLVGTNSSCDTAAAGTSNTIQLCAGSTAVYSATGGGTPSTSASTIAGTLNVVGALSQNGTAISPALSGTTSSIGGGALLAGACASGTVAVTNSTTAMAVAATPVTYPGDGAYWMGYVSTNGTVTVKVCAAVALTPSASTYNVRVIQ